MDIYYYNGELYHHGISGQKWGVRNGPPYPLNKSDRSKAERKLNTGKYGNKYDKSVSDEEAKNFWKGLAKTYENNPSSSKNRKTVKEKSTTDNGASEKNNSSNTGKYGNEYDKTVTDKEAQDFWKGLSNTFDISSGSKTQVFDPETLAYNTAKSNLAKEGKNVSTDSAEFKREYDRVYNLQMSIANFNAKQLNKGKSFVSRHSK